MDHSITPESATERLDDNQQAEWYLQSLREMIERMRADQVEINRLREERQIIQKQTDEVMARTWEILAQIRETG